MREEIDEHVGDSAARTLLYKMLQRDHKKRPQFRELMAEPAFVGWKRLLQR